jgi:ABC-2 type transport system ATP-binding protein
VGRRDIRDVLLRLREQGQTVFLNSHLLSELEMVCDRVAILVQGRVAQQGSIEDLTTESRRYEITIEGPGPAWTAGDESLRVRADKDDRTTLISKGMEPATVQPIIDRLRKERHTIVSVRPVRETLEDLFMRAVTDPVTGKVLAPGAAGAPQTTETPDPETNGGAGS